MLTIEEYIARRKKEDHLDEFNIKESNNNLRVCVNYVFEYYHNYLNITPQEERTVLKDEKIEKYVKQLEGYNKDIQEWLLGIFVEYDKRLNQIIAGFLKKEEFFFLFNSESEFRSVSYDCYAYLIKRYPFIKNETEMLYKFIKEYHYVSSQLYWESDKVFICEEITAWITGTWSKYQVNILRFVHQWVYSFCKNEDSWPTKHKRKNIYGDYEYDIKQKNNLFNLDSLYRRMPKKTFTRGRKQEFEILMMYEWIQTIEPNEDYWEEYLGKSLPSLRKSNDL